MQKYQIFTITISFGDLILILYLNNVKFKQSTKCLSLNNEYFTSISLFISILNLDKMHENVQKMIFGHQTTLGVVKLSMAINNKPFVK